MATRLLKILLIVFALSAFSVQSLAETVTKPGQQESSRSSMEEACNKELINCAVARYSRLTRISPENIPAEVKAELEDIMRPLLPACACLTQKIAAKMPAGAGNKTESNIDLDALLSSGECSSVDPATRIAARRRFSRIVGEAPSAISAMKVKRVPFTLTIAPNVKARQSLFASYTPPPERLTRLVFLAPGTGFACGEQELCIDNKPLEIKRPDEFLISHGRVLGKEGVDKLNKLTDKYGNGVRIVTSGSNFANFAYSQSDGRAFYSIKTIDGIPIEKTTAKKVWLVTFASQIPADPRALDFIGATTSVIEVEFMDQ